MKKFFCLFALGVGLAGATPITYSFAGIASGIFLSNANQETVFNDQKFSFDFAADTADVQQFAAAGFFLATFNNNSNVLITIGSESGNLQSLPQTGLFVGPGLVGALPGFGPEAAILSLFLANQINSVFSIANPAFATYDLQSSIGPIGGLVGINPNQREPANFIPVTFGAVELQSASDVTFTADLLATPEPLPVMLFSVGLIALGLLRKSTFILDRKR